MSNLKTAANNNNQLRLFLQNYLNNLDTLSTQKLILLIEFFIKSQMLDNKSNNDENNIDQKDLLKYAFLGYWIYKQLQPHSESQQLSEQI